MWEIFEAHVSFFFSATMGDVIGVSGKVEASFWRRIGAHF